MTIWDIALRRPISVLLRLGRRKADLIAIDPADLDAAHAVQHGQLNDPSLTAGQGDNAMSHEDPPAATRRNPTHSGRLNGCRDLGRKIGIAIAVIVIVIICGGVGILTLKAGPEVLVGLFCLLLCIGVPIALGIGYIWLQRRNEPDEEG